MKRNRRFLDPGWVAVLSFFALLCSAPEPSRGHMLPSHAEPKVGATVTGSPSHVRIWFDSAMDPASSTITVLDESGRKVDRGDGRVNTSDATLLEVSLSPLSSGIYRVLWNVTGRDGHRSVGDFTFAVK
ncbi:MAG: copper resistance protein CopC [Alphaproteobacteria bacterium]|uniref:Copper resistance protein CopC n=1 Tax=Candidatus Nitrobium versatile TaxID=2884831 RepID=A0A953SG25_9BACT|nr:copper resistance protein CopC [Candidatus Nitrobium versatile]